MDSVPGSAFAAESGDSGEVEGREAEIKGGGGEGDGRRWVRAPFQ